VPAGQDTAFFTIRAPVVVLSPRTVTIEARVGEVKKTAELTIQP